MAYSFSCTTAKINFPKTALAKTNSDQLLEDQCQLDSHDILSRLFRLQYNKPIFQKFHFMIFEHSQKAYQKTYNDYT